MPASGINDDIAGEFVIISGTDDINAEYVVLSSCALDDNAASVVLTAGI